MKRTITILATDTIAVMSSGWASVFTREEKRYTGPYLGVRRFAHEMKTAVEPVDPMNPIDALKSIAVPFSVASNEQGQS